MVEPFSVRVPGKAMLAGEYAVLAGGPAIVLSLGRHLECRVTRDSSPAIETPYGAWHDREAEPAALRFACAAWRVAGRYLEGVGKRAPAVRLALDDELKAPSGEKLGLGGSACAAVAVVAAALESAGVPSDRERTFKLAATAHALAQGSAGSGADVAASVFGGVLWTRRFDAGPLVALQTGPAAAFAVAVDRAQPPERESLPAPERLALAFTGASAATPGLIASVERYAIADPPGFARFLAFTSEAADRLRRGLLGGSVPEVGRAMADAQVQLERLGAAASCPIVTAVHRRILARAQEAGAAAKVSGAGGGDCCLLIGTAAQVDQAVRLLRQDGTFCFEPGVDDAGCTIGR